MRKENKAEIDFKKKKKSYFTGVFRSNGKLCKFKVKPNLFFWFFVGIEAPISGGEVRERKDQYKGVGVSVNDPFESYRKSKGQAFVERMRARAEERQ